MELKDLVGLHTLSGVSTENKTLPHTYMDDETYDASVISFILDGKVYTAIEDSNDGYRSAMGELKVDVFQCHNTFEPIRVLAIHETEQRGSYNSADVLVFYGMNGLPILSVGTSNSDDYYSSFVSYFQPENI